MINVKINLHAKFIFGGDFVNESEMNFLWLSLDIVAIDHKHERAKLAEKS